MHQRAVDERRAQVALEYAVDHGAGRAGGEGQMDLRIALIKVRQGRGNTHGGGTLQRAERKQSLRLVPRDHHPRLINQRQDLLAIA